MDTPGSGQAPDRETLMKLGKVRHRAPPLQHGIRIADRIARSGNPLPCA